jgi:CBS domain-containing protein
MPKIVRDIMTKYVVSIDVNRTALDAAKIMAEILLRRFVSKN